MRAGTGAAIGAFVGILGGPVGFGIGSIAGFVARSIGDFTPGRYEAELTRERSDSRAKLQGATGRLKDRLDAILTSRTAPASRPCQTRPLP